MARAHVCNTPVPGKLGFKLAFHFQREGGLSCGHQDRLFGHDEKLRQALRQNGPVESTKPKKSDLQETGRRKPYPCLPLNII